MNATTQAPPTHSPAMSPTKPLPWWRFGMAWMVFGGPALVVLACIATWVIADLGTDPVLDTGQRLRLQGTPSMAPAQMGRNHAATGVPIKP